MRSARTDPPERLPAGFRRLLVAWFASLTGDGMRFAAVPLLALATRPTAEAVSAVAAATALPWLLIALAAGALVDRLDPAKVIAAVNAARAVIVALLVVVIVSGQVTIPLLCVVGFLLTSAETFADSAGQSLLVRIVPAGQLERANARFVSSENVGLDLLGPLSAGALFAAAEWLPFAVAAVVFAFTAVWVLGLRSSARPPPGQPDQRLPIAGPAAAAELNTAVPAAPDPAPAAQIHSAASLQPDAAAPPQPATAAAESVPSRSSSQARLSVREAFSVIFASRDLRVLVITVGVMAAAIAGAEGVLVVYSSSSLHLPDTLYPTLLASYSLGLLLAAAGAGRWAGGRRHGPAMLAAVAAIGATLVVLGLFPHAVVAWCAFFLMGVGGGAWNVLSATRRQRRTPHGMVARVSSTFRAISWGALPIGTALGGVLGELTTVPTVFVVSGVVVLVLGAVMARFFLRSDADATVAGRPEEALEVAQAPHGPGAG